MNHNVTLGIMLRLRFMTVSSGVCMMAKVSVLSTGRLSAKVKYIKMEQS